MTDVIALVEEDLAAGWRWVKTEAVAFYDAVSPLIASALAGFEHSVVQALWGAAGALVQRLLHVTDLADLETALLNTLSSLRNPLLSAAQALGSMVLQSILGLLQVHAKQAA
jgi:hypothetical protein